MEPPSPPLPARTTAAAGGGRRRRAGAAAAAGVAAWGLGLLALAGVAQGGLLKVLDGWIDGEIFRVGVGWMAGVPLAAAIPHTPQPTHVVNTTHQNRSDGPYPGPPPSPTSVPCAARACGSSSTCTTA